MARAIRLAALARLETPLELKMKVLIFANELDNHVTPIRWALQQAGYDVHCWCGLAWTAAEQAWLLLREEPRMALGPHLLEPGDSVWLRQPDQPDFGPGSGDRPTPPSSHYTSFFASVASMIEMQPVRCINPYSASRLVRHKPVQLHFARVLGLKIPATLISNSPQPVRTFFETGRRIVCKPFVSHFWEQSTGGTAVAGTFELSRDQLPEDEVFTFAPAIYQQLIAKSFDVRTVLMGQAVYSFALRTLDGALDWRPQAALRKLCVEPIATPAVVEEGILTFAQKTGVCFGSIDFAVDASGEWWFLEINEQGQFLWLDQFHPAARLQEKFCAFLTAPENSREGLEAREHLFPSIHEYQRSPEKQRADELLAAVVAESRYITRES
jgi:glutathione synthase/RimK-type ligase-like ATP-grasp enzyme